MLDYLVQMKMMLTRIEPLAQPNSTRSAPYIVELIVESSQGKRSYHGELIERKADRDGESKNAPTDMHARDCPVGFEGGPASS